MSRFLVVHVLLCVLLCLSPPRARAIDFDGNNDVVDMGDVLDSVFTGTSATFTVACWIRPATDQSGNATFVAKQNTTAGDQRQWTFRRRGTQSDVVDFLWYGAVDEGGSHRSSRGTTPLNPGVWYHVVATYDATEPTDDHVTIYINGVDETTPNTSSGSPTGIEDGDASLSIGCAIGSTGTASIENPFDGEVDDVRIYNRVLSSGEVAGLYRGTRGRSRKRVLGGLGANLVGWWPMRDAAIGVGIDNTSVRDASGNGNDGTADGSSSIEISEPALKVD